MNIEAGITFSINNIGGNNFYKLIQKIDFSNTSFSQTKLSLISA
jgi:hypothetical protein